MSATVVVPNNPVSLDVSVLVSAVIAGVLAGIIFKTTNYAPLYAILIGFALYYLSPKTGRYGFLQLTGLTLIGYGVYAYVKQYLTVSKSS